MHLRHTSAFANQWNQVAAPDAPGPAGRAPWGTTYRSSRGNRSSRDDHRSAYHLSSGCPSPRLL
eukprot:74627-Chlamydomonas_euryale.AAC.14